MNIIDSLTSIVSGLGTKEHDKSASTYYDDSFISDTELKNAYNSSWVAKKIVDIPAQDCLRKWRNWSGEAEHLTQIELVENKLVLQHKLLKAYKLARLWGGSAVLIGTDQDKEKPLNIDSIKKNGLKYLTVLSKYELSAGELDDDVESENYGRPKYYSIANTDVNLQIHPSHLAIFHGIELEDDWGFVGGISSNYHSWGRSVLQASFDAIKNVDSASGNIASLIFEANVDVFGVEDLMHSVSDKSWRDKLLKRFTLAKLNKSVNKTLIRDSQEEYDRKQITFTGLPDILQQFLLVAAGAADIPLTRFLGQSPAGMSSAGSGDMKNYYDSITAKQSLEIQPRISILDECIIRSALGERPKELNYNWSPLEQINETEIAEIGKKTAETAQILVDSGLYTNEIISEVTANQLAQSGVFPGIDNLIAEEEKGMQLEND